MSVRLRNAILVSRQLFILLPAFPQLEFASFNSAWPVLSSLPRLDLSDPFIVSSWFGSTVIQQNSCHVHSRQPQEMNDSVCTQCLGDCVGGVVFTIHSHQSEAHLLHCFLATECFDVGDASPGQIHASSSCRELYTRSGRWQPISVRNCCSWMPHAAARNAAYTSASPLAKEMTPCVVELVSSTNFPSLDTTQELVFRRLGCPIAVSECIKVLQLCSNCKRPCKTRHVHEVPHNTSCSRHCSTRCMSDLTHEVHDKVLQVGSVRCHVTQHTNETAQPRFLYPVDWFVAVTLSGFFHSKACHTFRSCTVPITHVNACLS